MKNISLPITIIESGNWFCSVDKTGNIIDEIQFAYGEITTNTTDLQGNVIKYVLEDTTEENLRNQLNEFMPDAWMYPDRPIRMKLLKDDITNIANDPSAAGMIMYLHAQGIPTETKEWGMYIYFEELLQMDGISDMKAYLELSPFNGKFEYNG